MLRNLAKLAVKLKREDILNEVLSLNAQEFNPDLQTVYFTIPQ